MRIAKIMYNDTTNGMGINVSLWTQGCPHHCPGCHNPETWSFEGGEEITDLKSTLVKAINANGIMRNLSLLGGEPLCPQNICDMCRLISSIKIIYPNIKIFCWTGYTLQELQERMERESELKEILKNITFLIDGPFIQEKKDLSLWLRGSLNQNVYINIGKNKFKKIDREDYENENF